MGISNRNSSCVSLQRSTKERKSTTTVNHGGNVISPTLVSDTNPTPLKDSLKIDLNRTQLLKDLDEPEHLKAVSKRIHLKEQNLRFDADFFR